MGSVQRKFGEMEQAKSAKLVKFSGELPKILADGLVDMIVRNIFWGPKKTIKMISVMRIWPVMGT